MSTESLSAAFERYVSQVPEPCTSMLLVMGGFCLNMAGGRAGRRFFDMPKSCRNGRRSGC
jgi:hypothetical protein